MAFDNKWKFLKLFQIEFKCNSNFFKLETIYQRRISFEIGRLHESGSSSMKILLRIHKCFRTTRSYIQQCKTSLTFLEDVIIW